MGAPATLRMASSGAAGLLLLVLVATTRDHGPPCTTDVGEQATATSGLLAAGDSFVQPFADRFIFHLSPIERGWEVVIHERGREENLARLTPPWHFVPNPRHIEGWHFRNQDNTGPNDGGVNAPQHIRDFIFSPEVGRTIDYQGGGTPDMAVARVADFGRGRLVIVDYELTPPLAGERPSFRWMRFEACLGVRG